VAHALYSLIRGLCAGCAGGSGRAVRGARPTDGDGARLTDGDAHPTPNNGNGARPTGASAVVP
jgi:hypothetical protein